MLENACMREETMKERVGSVGTIPGSALSSTIAPKPDIIDEVVNES
jgi:hypothetical protein